MTQAPGYQWPNCTCGHSAQDHDDGERGTCNAETDQLEGGMFDRCKCTHYTPVVLTYDQARTLLRRRAEVTGYPKMSLVGRNGEYRVNFADNVGTESTAYYTNDLIDAFTTALAMEWRRRTYVPEVTKP